MLPWQHDFSLSLPAMQVGGKHVWRIEESVLEQFIQDQYTATRERQKAERAQ